MRLEVLRVYYAISRKVFGLFCRYEKDREKEIGNWRDSQ